MRVGVVLALCVLALLSVCGSVSGGPIVCPTQYSCVPLAGNCTTTSDLQVKSCTNSYKSYYGTHSEYCNCTAYEAISTTDTSVLGDNCTDTDQYSPLYYHFCTKSSVTQGSGPFQPVYKWYKPRYSGDVCSNNYWCLPPRVCVDGKCIANLAIGDTCYNSTVAYSQEPFGQCGVNAYCKTSTRSSFPYIVDGVCTARPTTGQFCDYSGGQCVPPAECDYTKSVCTVFEYYFVLPGQKANTSRQCTSGERNATSGLCYDLDAIKANAALYVGNDCTEEEDCGNWAYCDCNDLGVNNKPVCYTEYDYTVAELQANRARVQSNRLKLYTTGCEDMTTINAGTSTDFCRNRAAIVDDVDDDEDADCEEARIQIENGRPDCNGYYAAVCASCRTITVSFVSIVAMALFAWKAAEQN